MQTREKQEGRLCWRWYVAAVLLILVILLENLSAIANVPNVLLPTSQLFVVLKKGAVYSLVAVSMNLLNGFTGLFSLGQAGFMLLGAYTYAILTVPMCRPGLCVLSVLEGPLMKFSLQEHVRSGVRHHRPRRRL